MRAHLTTPGCLKLAAFDCAAAFVCASLLSSAFAQPAYAYVDPSIMTYTIQAVAGVAVALSAVAGVAFRRTRKVLMRKLNIDENANKIVDPPIYYLDENGRPLRDDARRGPRGRRSQSGRASANRRRPAQRRARKGGELAWLDRLWRAALAAAFLVGTVFVVAPAEMVASNPDSLVFSLADVWWPLVGRAFLEMAVLALALSLLKGAWFDRALALVAALGLCFYVQALFMNSRLPSADGAAFEIARHIPITIVSFIVWAVLLAGAYLFAKRNGQLGRTAALVASAALMFVQGVAVVSLWMGPANAGQAAVDSDSVSYTSTEPSIVSEEGLYEVAPKNNVIVFVLDAFDVDVMNQIVENGSDEIDGLTGFTYFKNSTGSSVPTRYGLPFLLTDSWPQADQSWDDYLAYRYTSSHFLDDMRAQNYALYIYTDTLGVSGSFNSATDYLAPRAVNIHPVDASQRRAESSFDSKRTVDVLYKMALYRDMPWILKGAFWFSTDEVNKAAFDVTYIDEGSVAEGRAGSTVPYVLDDGSYYERLKERRLSLHDDGTEGTMHFIHLFGSHIPYTLAADGTVVSESTVMEQSLGSLHIVNEYLDQMRELGVYDDATIIITADHGWWFWDEEIEVSEAEGDMAGGPIMIVKPAGAANVPMQVSDTRTGHVDFHATIINAIGGDTSSYGPTVFDEHDPNRVRYYYWPTHNGNDDLVIYEYAIDGEVTDWNAWSRTGTEWEFYK